jgi:hypothetical protein
MTNILQTTRRPYILFDAANPEHRAYYAQFCDIASWGKCPISFLYDPNYTDLIAHIQCELVKFYIQQEFNNVVQDNKVARKSKKVDNHEQV